MSVLRTNRAFIGALTMLVMLFGGIVPGTAAVVLGPQPDFPHCSPDTGNDEGRQAPQGDDGRTVHCDFCLHHWNPAAALPPDAAPKLHAPQRLVGAVDPVREGHTPRRWELEGFSGRGPPVRI